MTPSPIEHQDHVAQPTFRSDEPEWDKTPGPTEAHSDGQHGVHIVDSDLIEACIEAEKNFRLKQQLVPASTEQVLSPSELHTPAKLVQQVEADCSSVGTKSSSGPELHVRRIMKPTHAMQSPFDSKKQYTCSVEVSKLYALVLLHGRRATRGQHQEDIRLTPYFVFISYTGSCQNTALQVASKSCFLEFV